MTCSGNKRSLNFVYFEIMLLHVLVFVEGVTVVGNRTFGVSIDDLLRKSDGCEVPPIVTTIVEYIEKHG